MNWMGNPSRAFMYRTCPDAGYEWEGGGKEGTRSVSADNTPEGAARARGGDPLRVHPSLPLCVPLTRRGCRE
jgi:hypothetical protein